jgi:hypothetical protein
MQLFKQFAHLSVLWGILSLSACSSVNVVVDHSSIYNQARFERDAAQCRQLAESYDLKNDKIMSSLVGAGGGAVTTVGLASAILGTLYVPSAPFMVAGTLGGGSLGNGWMSYKENATQEKILTQCLTRKGYRAYSAE